MLDQLINKAFYNRSTFEDVNGYKNLLSMFADLDVCNIVYYLATPPDEYVNIIRHIGESEIIKNCDGWTRIVIEKPYGNDLESAKMLEKEVHQVFTEDQIYRIDHYLGKGNRPEYIGFPVRKWHFRSIVEQAICRSCANYRWGNGWGGNSCRVL